MPVKWMSFLDDEGETVLDNMDTGLRIERSNVPGCVCIETLDASLVVKGSVQSLALLLGAVVAPESC